MSDTERGEKLTPGPFQFRTPDRPCRIADCEERADGVVDMENATINACIYCAPQFLQHERNEWRPLAGGRALQTGGDQRD